MTGVHQHCAVSDGVSSVETSQTCLLINTASTLWIIWGKQSVMNLLSDVFLHFLEEFLHHNQTT